MQLSKVSLYFPFRLYNFRQISELIVLSSSNILGEPVIIKGKPYRFSRTEIYEIIDIAHSLNISEDFAATMHQHAKELKSRYNKPIAETAIALYYDEKTYMLLSLLIIFSKAYDIEVKEKVRDVLKTFINGLFKSYENLNQGHLY